jgi:hypothetical protein
MRQGDVFVLSLLLLATSVLHTAPFIVAKGSRRSVVSEALDLRTHSKTNKAVENAEEEACFHFSERPTSNSSLDAVCACETLDWQGRLGNRLQIAKHMIGEAVYLSCAVVLPRDMLPGWNPPEHSWLYNVINKDPRNASLTKNLTCGSRKGEEWYGRKSSAPKCYLQLLRKYFGINQTHALGKACSSTEHVAMHVRSGDVASGGWSKNQTYSPQHVHKDYGFFPTAYYMSMMRDVRARRGDAVIFFVFCKNMGNPTCEFFEKLSYLDNRLFLRVGEPLIDDLFLMLCASETAASHGTFHNAFDLSAARRISHSFSYNPKPATRCGDASVKGVFTVHWIASSQKAAKFEKVTKIWKNTGFQRHKINAAFDMNHTDVLFYNNCTRHA